MARIAIIGGTGAALFPRGGTASLPAAAPGRWGPASAAPQLWHEAGHEVLFLPRHGEAGSIPPHRVNYRANIALIADWRADGVIALNAVGAIAAGLRAGGLALPDQLIDYTYGRAHSYYDNRLLETVYIDFTEPYDANLRAELSKAAAVAGVALAAGGTYGATQGPRLETAAEINRLERDGCTVVGMTGMPEAALARELGLPYASLCLLVNPAAGRGGAPIHADIERYLQTAVLSARDVIRQFLQTHTG